MRKKHPEHVNLERWLVSYADFITLLFAFFVIMYAISQADKDKFKAVAASMRNALGQAGPAGMLDLGGAGGGSSASPFEAIEVPGGRALNLPAGRTNTAADPDPGLQEVRELLEESISLELGVTDPSERVLMEYDANGLIVRVAAKHFFDHGEIEVAPDLRPVLDRIARVLSKTDRLIRIEGHADPSEEKVPGFASAWELSAARAAWVARYWLKRFEFQPRRIGVSGYGAHRPVSYDRDHWGKGANRRIEIIILNNRYRLHGDE